MSMLKPNPALEDLEPLVGEWEVAPPQSPWRARTVFAWLEAGACLVQRWPAPEPAPSSTWVIGRDDATAEYTVLYADSRGVSRVYRMRFGDGSWTMWRDAPGFSQRWTARLSEDARTITGRWEKCQDGSTWEHDFDLVYTKV